MIMNYYSAKTINPMENVDSVFRVGRVKIPIAYITLTVIMTFGIMTTYVSTPIYILLRLIQYICYGMMIVHFALRYRKLTVCVFGIIAVAMAGTWVLFPQNRPALNEVIPAVMFQGFYFMVGYSCLEAKTAVKFIRVGAYADILFTAYVIFIMRGSTDHTAYDIISNGLFWACLFFTFSPKNKARNWTVAAIAFLLILLYGRRSHVLFFVLTILLSLFREVRGKKSRGKLALIILATLVIVVVAINYKSVLLLLSRLEFLGGSSSRTITALLNNDFLDLNGRDALYKTAIDLAKQHPIIGNGIGSTMVAWHDSHIGMPNYLGGNTHNSILEVAAEFGFIGMAVFVIVHVKIIGRITTIPLSPEEKQLLFMLSGTGLISVLVGSSYLNTFRYALFLGYYFRLRARDNTLKCASVQQYRI